VLSGAAAAASVAVAYAALERTGGSRLSHPAPVGDYDEAATIETEAGKIGHLLRRAGFGASRLEYQRYLRIGLDATLDELVNYEAVDDTAVETMVRDPAVARQGIGPAWLVRMANTKRPLQEKMTLFWHGLLTTQATAVPDSTALSEQNQLYRRNATGVFRDLLKGITRDRAMMVYLDIDGSSRTAPNENFARELMELFSMGAGNFSESDVREAARAFTGWSVRRPDPSNLNILGELTFDPARHDAGEKTVLGRTGNLGPDDLVDIVADRPETARHIVRRLFSYFVYEDPDDAELDPFVQVYEQNGGRIGAVVESILRSDVFYSRRAYRALVRSPAEFAVAAIKAVGAESDTIRILSGRSQAMRGMGQVLFDPPNVAGWPGGASWLSTSSLLARLNFANQLTGGVPLPGIGGFRGSRNGPTPGPTPTATPLPALGTASYALGYYLPHMLDDNLPRQARDFLIEYAGGQRALLNADSLRGLVYLLLASPMFQLA
jgi:hypothetical protein